MENIKSNLIVSDAEPTNPLQRRENFIWMNKNTGQLNHFVGGAWVVEVDTVITNKIDEKINIHSALSDIHHSQFHEHPTLGDVDFKGEITVAGEHTETLKIQIKGVGTLVFTHGLLTYFEKE